MSFKIMAFRRQSTPFALGGKFRFIKCEIEIEGPLIDLGKGFEGYLAVSPDGTKTYVIEHISGGIVGNTIEQVEADIVACDDQEMMAEQVDQACEDMKKAISVSEEEFWSGRIG